jgi:integrase
VSVFDGNQGHNEAIYGMSKVTLNAYQIAKEPEYKWLVAWPNPVPGKRKLRKRFKTRAAAAKFKTDKETEIARVGVDAASVQESAIDDAAWCVRQLEPYGANLRDVVAEWITAKEAAKASAPVSEAIEEALAAKRRAGRTQDHLSSMQSRLRRFGRTFGDRPLVSITAEEIEHWLHGLNVAPVTLNGFRRYIGGLFGFAVKRGWVEKNPVDSIDVATVKRGPVEIYTPAEIRITMDMVPDNLLAPVAIAIFAGLRPKEIQRLDWQHVDFLRERIQVDGKGAKHRYVPLSSTLRAWLDPVAQPSGPVVPTNYVRRLTAFKHALRDAGVNVIADGWRHSFASYEAARIQDIGKLASILGNSPGVIHQHYRERVLPEEAEAFFSVIKANAKILRINA